MMIDYTYRYIRARTSGLEQIVHILWLNIYDCSQSQFLQLACVRMKNRGSTHQQLLNSPIAMCVCSCSLNTGEALEVGGRQHDCLGVHLGRARRRQARRGHCPGRSDHLPQQHLAVSALQAGSGVKRYCAALLSPSFPLRYLISSSANMLLFLWLSKWLIPPHGAVL